MARYVDNIPSSSCPALFNMDRRTFFRKLMIALERFQRVLSKNLSNCSNSQKVFSDNFLSDILQRGNRACVDDSEGRLLKNDRDYLCGLIINKLRKFN